MNKAEEQYAQMTRKLHEELQRTDIIIEKLEARRQELMELLWPTLEEIKTEEESETPAPEPTEEPAEEPKIEPMAVEQGVLTFLSRRKDGAKKSAIVSRVGDFPVREVENAINRLRKRGEIVSTGPGRNSVWVISK